MDIGGGSDGYWGYEFVGLLVDLDAQGKGVHSWVACGSTSLDLLACGSVLFAEVEGDVGEYILARLHGELISKIVVGP